MTELSAWFAFFPSFPTGELFKQLLAAGDYKDAPQKFADVATAR